MARDAPRRWSREGRRRTSVALLTAAITVGCGEPVGRWSGTDWFESYAALPEVTLEPLSSGALDETTQPFPALRRIAVSPQGRIAVVQEGIPAVWVYDERGRSLGRVGRSEIMNARGPQRSRIWAERAGWLPGERLWVGERGGAVAIFNGEMNFSDVWDAPAASPPLTVTVGSAGTQALVLNETEVGRSLVRVSRGGGATSMANLTRRDTVIVCPDASCFVSVESLGDSLGVRFAIESGEGPGSATLPAAPEGTRSADGSLPSPVRDLLAEPGGRVWVGLSEDDSERGYWVVLGPDGEPVGRFHLTGGQRGIYVADGVFWTRRDADGVTWLHRYSYTQD